MKEDNLPCKGRAGNGRVIKEPGKADDEENVHERGGDKMIGDEKRKIYKPN